MPALPTLLSPCAAPLMAMAQLKGDISNPYELHDLVHRVAAQARAER